MATIFDRIFGRKVERLDRVISGYPGAVIPLAMNERAEFVGGGDIFIYVTERAR